MKISSDDQRGIGVILLYAALLFFLIGMAGHMKSDFHYRAEIFTGGLTVAAVLATGAREHPDAVLTVGGTSVFIRGVRGR